MTGPAYTAGYQAGRAAVAVRGPARIGDGYGILGVRRRAMLANAGQYEPIAFTRGYVDAFRDAASRIEGGSP